MRPLRPRTRAFTLIELLCVIGIIGILLGLLVGPIGRAYSKAKALQDDVESGGSPIAAADPD